MVTRCFITLQTLSSELQATRFNVMMSLSAAARDSYRRAYRHFVQLHMLREIEQFALNQVCCGYCRALRFPTENLALHLFVRTVSCFCRPRHQRQCPWFQHQHRHPTRLLLFNSGRIVYGAPNNRSVCGNRCCRFVECCLPRQVCIASTMPRMVHGQ